MRESKLINDPYFCPFLLIYFRCIIIREIGTISVVFEVFNRHYLSVAYLDRIIIKCSLQSWSLLCAQILSMLILGTIKYFIQQYVVDRPIDAMIVVISHDTLYKSSIILCPLSHLLIQLLPSVLVPSDIFCARLLVRIIEVEP